MSAELRGIRWPAAVASPTENVDSNCEIVISLKSACAPVLT
jgi:hypothetical protein